MKKTYKTNNGENRSSFFCVGRKLVTVRFLPTFTTENPMVQDAIEKSAAFREGIQLVTSSMQWIKIDRDENGFATEECLEKIFNNLPCAVCFQTEDGCKYYFFVNKYLDMCHNREDIRTNTGYTHYLPIPKLEV